MWTIWWRRNQKCWNEQLLPVNNVIRRARDSLLDWIHTQKKHSRQQQQQQQQQQQNSAMACYVWTKPARGTLKCNFDTVCYDAQNLYCVGACIRDDRSMFVEAIMRNYNGKPLIAEAEAHGVLEVLQCCLALFTTTLHSYCSSVASVLPSSFANPKGQSVVTLFRFGETAMSHTKTRMEETWTIEELAFNVPGLSIDCYIPPSELRFASISEASELPAFHKSSTKATKCDEASLALVHVDKPQVAPIVSSYNERNTSSA
ncbi:hypothetical protein TSUD_57780 [Trifolium subterraneum]|uniref:RNase H type-1 domain-containing protein n=1 Tax=Trifolium subterraneum TaxID=3900 RepID=A0A2Z6NKP9_TRISU|nr:hypothetical protein TSUD_57780 [Trifolium subterraneum]